MRSCKPLSFSSHLAAVQLRAHGVAARDCCTCHLWTSHVRFLADTDALRAWRIRKAAERQVTNNERTTQLPCCGNLQISRTNCLRLGTRKWEYVTNSGHDGMTCAGGRKSAHAGAPSSEIYVRAFWFTHTGISCDSVLHPLSSLLSIQVDCNCRPISRAGQPSSPHATCPTPSSTCRSLFYSVI